MKAKLSDDLQYITLFYDNENEQLQTCAFFRRRVDNYYVQRKLRRNVNMFSNFLIGYDHVKSTQWNNVRVLCERYGFPLELIGFEPFFRNISIDDVRQFCTSITDHIDITPYDYQIEAVYHAFRNRFCRLDIGTGGGKTLIMYLYWFLLRHTKQTKHTLIIEPDPNLVMQTYQEFDSFNSDRFRLKLGQAYGDSKDRKFLDRYDHVIGNFATLGKYDQSFFSKFDTIICDESHRSTASTIKNIIKSCGKTVNLLGLSGSSIVGESAEAFQNEDNFGHVVYSLSKKDLVDKGATTDTTVRMVTINFTTPQQRQEISTEKDYIEDPERCLRYEQNFIRQARNLSEWKAQFVIRLQGNSIVYFNDKKGQYGKNIYRRVQELNVQLGLNKKIYFQDGDTSQVERERIKSQIREDRTGQSILFANYVTFSTGQSIKNLVNAVFLEAFKSNVQNNQTIGRLARLSDGKEMTYLYDFIEKTDCKVLDVKTGRQKFKTCFMSRWAKERERYYQSEGFKIEKFEISC